MSAIRQPLAGQLHINWLSTRDQLPTIAPVISLICKRLPVDRRSRGRNATNHSGARACARTKAAGNRTDAETGEACADLVEGSRIAETKGRGPQAF